MLKKIRLEDTGMYKKIMEISHPNLVRIKELTTIENDFYAVEEYIQGLTLEGYIREKDGLADDEIKKIAADICVGLKPLHEKCIVHRDLTPANIMITDEGSAVIIDFGISRVKKANRTEDTQILGTQGFAAPEQFGFSQTDNRADIYSVGVLMNFMKTQALPQEKPAGGELGKIISKCIAPDVADRYQSVDELSVMLVSKIHTFSIPGFRKRKLWHMVIAMLYYFLAAVFAFWVFESELPNGILTAAQNTIGVLLMMIAPVFIVFCFGHWLDKWYFTRNSPKWKKYLIIIFFIFISFLISCLFFISIN
ncbi:MAG: serine/threonine protein kinase [Clostridia bacterium]|nr:serine/threonine protein kinase [Clostridia bacterium]